MVTAFFYPARRADGLILASVFLFFLSLSTAVWAQSPLTNTPPSQASNPPTAPAPSSPVALAVQALLKEGTVSKLRYGQFTDFQAQLQALYRPRGFAPLWTRDGKGIPQAQKVVTSLAAADEKGLNSADYDADLLAKWLDKLNSQASPGQQDQANFDVALSVSLMRYTANLYMGRINPKRLNFNLDIEPKKLDSAALLRKIADSDNPDALMAEMEPKLKLYGYLKTALARYRQLEKDTPGVQVSLPPKFKPGASHADVPKIRKRLAVLGDLTEGSGDDPSTTYDKPLGEAVKRFQARHGLAADAVIGKGTQAQLNVPIAERVKQIQLGLERLRWLPSHIPGRHIIVNVPSFQLFGFHNGNEADQPDLVMNVIVGQAIDGRNTPVFHSDMTYVNFRPYWNVPPSIAVKEYAPILSRNPGYLGRNNMEIVSSYAPDATAYGVSRGTISQLASGALKLRQKPGPKNALGLVKFAFPNTNNVYLHSTPAQGLFQRTRRDFSHGCIRVEFPVTLAEFVLKDHNEWNRETIDAAMHAEKSKIVTVKPAIPVFIFYSTVLANAEGQAMFYQDLYGHDAVLSAELAKGFPYQP